MFCYVWEYRVRPENVSTFEAGYGPSGEWVDLFSRDPRYLRTELLRDREDPSRFITIDYWTSREACLAFREQWREQFTTIDQKYDEITESEMHLGDFDVDPEPSGSD